MEPDWRHYKIYPNEDRMESEEFYAPDLTSAFNLARKRWPCAKTLGWLRSKIGA